MTAALQDGLATAISVIPRLIVIIVAVAAIAAAVKKLVENTLGAGGGLVKPLQARSEGYLSTAEEQVPTVEAHAQEALLPTAQARAKDEVQDLSQH